MKNVASRLRTALLARANHRERVQAASRQAEERRTRREALQKQSHQVRSTLTREEVEVDALEQRLRGRSTALAAEEERFNEDLEALCTSLRQRLQDIGEEARHAAAAAVWTDAVDRLPGRETAPALRMAELAALARDPTLSGGAIAARNALAQDALALASDQREATARLDPVLRSSLQHERDRRRTLLVDLADHGIAVDSELVGSIIGGDPMRLQRLVRDELRPALEDALLERRCGLAQATDPLAELRASLS
jgi:hypothetical protein